MRVTKLLCALASTWLLLQAAVPSLAAPPLKELMAARKAILEKLETRGEIRSDTQGRIWLRGPLGDRILGDSETNFGPAAENESPFVMMDLTGGQTPDVNPEDPPQIIDTVRARPRLTLGKEFVVPVKGSELLALASGKIDTHQLDLLISTRMREYRALSIRERLGTLASGGDLEANRSAALREVLAKAAVRTMIVRVAGRIAGGAFELLYPTSTNDDEDEQLRRHQKVEPDKIYPIRLFD